MIFQPCQTEAQLKQKALLQVSDTIVTLSEFIVNEPKLKEIIYTNSIVETSN